MKCFALLDYSTLSDPHAAPNIVLSAAHCQPESLGSVQAHVNPFDVETPNLNSLLSSVSEIRIHPAYSSNQENDVMLLKLSSSVSSSVASPVRLNTNSNEPQGGDSLTAVGWGTTVSGVNAPPPVLQEVNVNYITNQDCQSKYDPDYDVTADMLCCQESGQGSCQGDSGGPLVIRGTSEDVQVGIVSWGIGCALPEYPGKAHVANVHYSGLRLTLSALLRRVQPRQRLVRLDSRERLQHDQ